ncbi:hypothetical protein NQ317_018163 [Molorchus minor]|uniref:Farnesol dehydrogenase n=1 Tax=Molorchus minor TaxID=1323400 RepID=A0ABQ9J1R5_9CUCU|nr:hypothetical protein NQ317_018163 [Molorchus minor]
MVSSMDRWVGKVAVVTGASGGIGAAIAEQLVEKGLKVVALARRKERLDELAKKLANKKGKLYPVKTDISKEEDIINAFKWVKENLGPVHILVNNAGIFKMGSTLTDGDTETWRSTFDVNVLGLCIATREAVRDMKANNVDGHIIHINSVGGHSVPPIPGVNVYPASKYAVTALAETLRLELNSQKSRIKITSLSPGAVSTEIVGGVVDKLIKSMEKHKELILDSQDIADAVVYVLSTPPHVQFGITTLNNITMVLSVDRWIGKVAIVTGASSGIGAAIAERLAEHGLRVAALARRKDRLEGLADKVKHTKGKIYPIKADLSKEEDVLNAFKWIKENLGPIHILVNNAGTGGPGSLHDGTTENWRKTFEVNVLGLCVATREAIKDMKSNNVDGHIIHINSVCGHQVFDFPESNVYPASKYAVTALAETLRLELNSLKLKIKVTVMMSPGAVLTEFMPDDFKSTTEFKKMVEEKQILDPEDVADGVVYVLSTPPHVQIQELTIRPVIESF